MLHGLKRLSGNVVSSVEGHPLCGTVDGGSIMIGDALIKKWLQKSIEQQLFIQVGCLEAWESLKYIGH